MFFKNKKVLEMHPKWGKTSTHKSPSKCQATCNKGHCFMIKKKKYSQVTIPLKIYKWKFIFFFSLNDHKFTIDHKTATT